MIRTNKIFARASSKGFTLIEALIASALLGFSLIVMFGFHTQAVRSNMNARKMTDCTYLAQMKMEQLLAVPWTSGTIPSSLSVTTDTTSASGKWVTLGHSTGSAVNSRNLPVTTGYEISWDVQNMDTEPTWKQIKVRCRYFDSSFGRYHGTNISSYRFRDS